jgi:hypothetical protein
MTAHPDTALTAPTLADIGTSSLGLLAMMGAASLGHSAHPMGGVGVSALAGAAGATLLTGPALVVVHQFLGMHAEPTNLVHALGQGFVDAGRIAMGLTPVVLLLGLTSRLALPVAAVGLVGLGALTLLLTYRRLQAAERSAPASTWASRHGMALLATAWSTLCALIAVRIALGIALLA